MIDIKTKTCPNPNCGKQIPEYAIKCKYCGTYMNATSADKGAKRGGPVLPVLEPFKLGGVYSGLVMLTPPKVKQTTAPGLLKDCAVLEIDLSTNVRQLHSDIWIDKNSRKRTIAALKGVN